MTNRAVEWLAFKRLFLKNQQQRRKIQKLDPDLKVDSHVR